MNYPVFIVWSAEDESFLAEVFDLPGCVADGATEEEALQNARGAVAEWIATAAALGRSIPEPSTLGTLEAVQREEAERLEAEFSEAVAKQVSELLPGLVSRIRQEMERGRDSRRYAGGGMRGHSVRSALIPT